MAQSACNPLVSIIIPAYNYGRFLADTLESILSQTCELWECIIVDDGSTDNTTNIVEHFCKLDQRIQYLRQNNQGPSAARNNGIRHAVGVFFQFIDADDRISSRKLEMQTNYLLDHPGVDLVYGGARYFRDGEPDKLLLSLNGSATPWMAEISGQDDELVRQLLADNIMVISAPLIRRELIELSGLFDESLKFHEDWEFWLRCALAGGRFVYLADPEMYSLIRCHPSSLTNEYYNMNYYKLLIRERVAERLPGNALLEFNRQKIVELGVMVSLERIKNGYRLDGLKQLLKYSSQKGDYSLLAYGVKLAVWGS